MKLIPFDPASGDDVPRCPNAKKCAVRELARWIATAIIAIVCSYASGCYLKVQGPGFNVETAPNEYPPQPATAPAN